MADSAKPSPYPSAGMPSKENQGIWISSRIGENTSRAWGAAFYEKGHDVTMIKTVKSNENPTCVWGKLAAEMPGRSSARESRKKKKTEASR
mmetsp:Transcript_130721/g.326144  ORF Transcript_130721/g.326144 Transcript_130721/m.326144 type:complete len:91 (-) Transcript_130721:45-317(-)